MKIQYLTNKNGDRTAVVVPMRDYNKMLEKLDEYVCICAYDKAKSHTSEFVPAVKMFRAIDNKRSKSNYPLPALRN